jgi:DNA-binding transcriptional regulator YhcF (GntR family)
MRQNGGVALIALDPGSAVPPSEQVRRQIADAVRSGSLLPGVRLPTVRRLADDLRLAANTVAKAYRELELAGLVETRGRQGSFVAGPPSQTRERAVRAARDYLGQMAELGYAAAEALAIVQHEADGVSEAHGSAGEDGAAESLASPRRYKV